MFISEAWLGVYIVGGEFYSNESRAPEVNFFMLLLIFVYQPAHFPLLTGLAHGVSCTEKIFGIFDSSDLRVSTNRNCTVCIFKLTFKHISHRRSGGGGGGGGKRGGYGHP